MHTVSTLCATSTVGIAACGFALALPHCTTNDHLPNLPANFNTNTPPLLEEPLDGSPNEAKFPQLTPTSACIPPPLLQRPSTSRRWLRRLSESFSSSPTNSLSLSSPSSVSSTSSRTHSSTASQPSSRPPTRNKLVKRSPAERLFRANSPVLPPRQNHRRRPSTAIYQPPTCEQSTNPLPSPFQVSRPSTSVLEFPHFCPSDLESVDVWRPFFPSKRQRFGLGATKLTKKAPAIRRIVPDLFKRRQGPTLVIAPTINCYPSATESTEDDTNSLFTDTASIQLGSRPVSHHMGETQTQWPTRQRSSTAPIPKRTRKFSLSNFLGVMPKSIPSETIIDDDAISNGFVGICSVGARRHSTSDARPTAHQAHRNTRPSTSAFDSMRREQLPTIQSLSLLDLDPDPEQDPSPTESASNSGAQSEEHSSESSLSAPALSFAARRHRLSMLSASERASTLIGSDSEHDFGSDTLFDSMRTRISEMTPVRVDRIFDFDRCQTDIQSPLQANFQHAIPIVSPHTTPTIRGYGFDRPNSSPISTHATEQHFGVAITLDDDEDGWSSDWDIPSKSADGDDRHLSSQSGLRPYNGIFNGSRMGLGLQSNGSNTSFGTAREGFSVDGSSMRETNSILDWNDGVSMHRSTSPSNGYRPKTVHAKESILSSNRTGRRAPTYHVRSQSVPVVNTLRGRTPLPSENWDDDFLDDDDGEFGMSKSNMVIPRAIEERQASIIGHLGCVREFALLVEDLKRLREAAVAKNIRNKVDRDLWDEADGIIALATLDDDEEDAPLKKDGLRRQNTWSPQQRRREQQAQRVLEENNHAYTTASNRHTVLPSDDEILGGNDGNLPSTPRNSRRLSPAPSSISPLSRKTVDKNDPIEVAKSMMEKMQHRQRSADSLNASWRNHQDGKVHFDTDMLRNLVIQTGHLKQKLTRSVEGYPPSSEKCLRLKIRTVESPTDDKFDFDLSPIKSSIDEELRGLDRVNSNGLEYTPVIGVA